MVRDYDFVECFFSLFRSRVLRPPLHKFFSTPFFYNRRRFPKSLATHKTQKILFCPFQERLGNDERRDKNLSQQKLDHRRRLIATPRTIGAHERERERERERASITPTPVTRTISLPPPFSLSLSYERT